MGVSACCEDQLIACDADAAFAPAARGLHRLVDRQRVEELVGDDDDRTVGHLVERGMPRQRRRDATQRLLLLRFQRRTDLDEMHACRSEKAWHHLRRAQCVAHQRAAARTELDQTHARRGAHLLPHRGHPQSDQLAEHLAHFRRGDEVATRSERIARHVITVPRIGEAERHVVGNRHRSVRGDARTDVALERRGHQLFGSGGCFIA